MVRGLPEFKSPLKLCKDCLVGKQKRDPFPKKINWRASQVLELVHADLCGPIQPISNSKQRYLITFIDDFSRKLWVYFLLEKSEAFVAFKRYKALVEKEANFSIKSLCTDQGGEFISREFTNFCVDNGIKRQLTTAYTPQQNGVAERKNRTIMNMVRSMLSEKKIPKTFWPEAVNWTVHVLNRSPTLAVRNMTPEEAWNGVKPSVEYFRVFGCTTHVHVPDSTRTKLDDKSLICVLLGVSEESKAYRLYDPVKQKIIISRDVIFEEDKNWDWDKNYAETIICDLEWGDCVDEAAAEVGEGNESDYIDEEIEETLSSDPSSEDIPSPQNQGRIRVPPTWMQDYETGDGLSEDDADVLMFTTIDSDPIHFEEAVKSDKWRKAMDAEIEAIKRNDTWELIDLPEGGKKLELSGFIRLNLMKMEK